MGARMQNPRLQNLLEKIPDCRTVTELARLLEAGNSSRLTDEEFTELYAQLVERKHQLLKALSEESWPVAQPWPNEPRSP
jgi:hypothetical protein